MLEKSKFSSMHLCTQKEASIACIYSAEKVRINWVQSFLEIEQDAYNSGNELWLAAQDIANWDFPLKEIRQEKTRSLGVHRSGHFNRPEDWIAVFPNVQLGHPQFFPNSKRVLQLNWSTSLAMSPWIPRTRWPPQCP